MRRAWTLILLLLLAGCDVHSGPANRSRPWPCGSNLKEIALATLLYVQDHNMQFPKASGMRDIPGHIQQHVKSPNAFACPVTSKGYLFNTALSGAAMASVAAPADTPLFKDAAPHADGTVGVAFVDGHVKQFPAAEVGALGGRFQ